MDEMAGPLYGMDQWKDGLGRINGRMEGSTLYALNHKFAYSTMLVTDFVNDYANDPCQRQVLSLSVANYNSCYYLVGRMN